MRGTLPFIKVETDLWATSRMKNKPEIQSIKKVLYTLEMLENWISTEIY